MNCALEFEYTFNEYVEANRSHFRLRRLVEIAWYFVAPLLLFALAYTIVETVLYQSEPVSVNQFSGDAFLVAIIFASSPFSFRFMMRRQWKRQPQLHRRVKYEIDPDSVRVTTETSTGEMTWANFIRFVESKNLFLLYPNKIVFHMIPKRAFASAEEMDSFRELATSKIAPSK
jgi:hypothetical protein